jgi:hypothetical protein
VNGNVTAKVAEFSGCDAVTDKMQISPTDKRRAAMPRCRRPRRPQRSLSTSVSGDAVAASRGEQTFDGLLGDFR